jgi:hypothetical protein
MSNEFVPPPGATRMAINSSVMGWVDENGVVLHSWRKTKRGTRGGGQRRRVEADGQSAAAATPSEINSADSALAPSQRSCGNSAAWVDGKAAATASDVEIQCQKSEIQVPGEPSTDFASNGMSAAADSVAASALPLQADLSGTMSCMTAGGSETAGDSEREDEGIVSGLVTPRLRQHAASDVAAGVSTSANKVDGVLPVQASQNGQSSETPKQLAEMQLLLVRHNEVLSSYLVFCSSTRSWPIVHYGILVLN